MLLQSPQVTLAPSYLTYPSSLPGSQAWLHVYSPDLGSLTLPPIPSAALLRLALSPGLDQRPHAERKRV